MYEDKIGRICEDIRKLKRGFNLLSIECEHVVDTLVHADYSITYICNKVGKLCAPDCCPLETKPTSKARLIQWVLEKIGG